MSSFNKVIMLGNLTRDPELSYLPSQTPVVEFTLATNHRYKGSDGQMKESPCFIDCRMYGKRAEVIQKYCSKGQSLLIEGRLTLDRWEAQDGSKRSKHRIFVENFEFTGGGSGGSDTRDTAPGPSEDEIPQGSMDDVPF